MEQMISASILFAAILGLSTMTGAVRGDETNAGEPATRPVEAQLKAKADEFAQKSPEAAKVAEDGIAQVAATGIVELAPKVGDKAGLFELPDANGQVVKLADLLSKGPVVLTWYRGGWCPF